MAATITDLERRVGLMEQEVRSLKSQLFTIKSGASRREIGSRENPVEVLYVRSRATGRVSKKTLNDGGSADTFEVVR